MNQMVSLSFKRTAFLGTSLLLLTIVLAGSAQAHHPFAMGDSSELNAFQGLLSGIGNPLLGPDHLLFMVALLFLGLAKPKEWVLPLVALGLLGSGISQVIPIPAGLETAGEALVSLSLVVEGCVALNLLPTWILLPCITLHGYLLGAAITGAEPTPLVAYFAGLAIAQTSMLLVVSLISERFIKMIGISWTKILAGIWMGIGFAFAWSVVIP